MDADFTALRILAEAMSVVVVVSNAERVKSGYDEDDSFQLRPELRHGDGLTLIRPWSKFDLQL
jgi:hypothetical protein